MSDLWTDLAQAKTLTGPIRVRIADEFGDRGKKALHAVDEGHVIQYRDFFVVTGSTGEYVVEEDFCTCSDFLFRKKECLHILAVRISSLTGKFRADERWYQDILREGRPGRKGTR